MADELEQIIRKALLSGIDSAAIAAALRSRWPWIDWPCVYLCGDQAIITKEHRFQQLKIRGDQCIDCGQPKPGPATGESSFTAVVKGKKVEAGDAVKLNDDSTVSKITPADERGEDQEVIRMWREHDKHS